MLTPELIEAIVPKDVNVNTLLVNTSWPTWNLAVEATGTVVVLLEPSVVPPTTCVTLPPLSKPSLEALVPPCINPTPRLELITVASVVVV